MRKVNTCYECGDLYDNYNLIALPQEPTLEISTSNELQLSPNPAVSKIQVNYQMESAGRAILRLLNINGQLIKSINLDYFEGLNSHELDIHHLEAGLHMLVLETKENTLVKRFIKVDK